jgi:predicted nuclease of predicted toxin-antitoxin system
VKLLFDQNLSRSLVASEIARFPGSAHVRDFDLESADDEEIWIFGAAQGFTIVSKDSDFRQRSFLRGAPPKVIWLNVGNCSTSHIERIFLRSIDQIVAFDGSIEAAFLELR